MNRTGRCRSCSVTTKKAIPDDFAARAAVVTNHELCAYYGIGVATLWRWRKATGVAAPNRYPAPEMPDDFAQRARITPRFMLSKHYGRGIKTIDQWCADLGIVPPVGQRGGRKPATSKADKTFGTVCVIVARDTTLAGRAADYLRRFGPVVRCDAAGHFDPKGAHYRRNAYVLTADEIVERAKWNGWNPDAWREVVAA